MGYNHQLRDFDLRLAANTALAFLIISKENLNERHQQRNAGDLALDHWKYSNQLELYEPIRTQLRTQLRDLIDNHNEANIATTTDQLIDSHFSSISKPKCTHVADSQEANTPHRSNRTPALELKQSIQKTHHHIAQ